MNSLVQYFYDWWKKLNHQQIIREWKNFIEAQHSPAEKLIFNEQINDDRNVKESKKYIYTN